MLAGDPLPVSGRRLRQRMDQLNVAPKDLAKLLGVSDKAVYHWLNGVRGTPGLLDCALRFLEAGGRKPPPKSLSRRALRQRMDALNVSPRELAGMAGVTRQAVYFWLEGKHPIPPLLDLCLRYLEEQILE